MSKLKDLLKVSVLLGGTGLATYAGMEIGEVIKDYVHQGHLIPEMTKGLTAITTGNLGFFGTKKVVGKKSMNKSKAYNISALNAFANTPNNLRKVTSEESLEEISNNLVEIYIKNGEKSGVGSGLMITNNGYTITAQHVLEGILNDGAIGVIGTQNGEFYHVKKENITYNKTKDIAIITPTFPHISFPRSKPIKAKIAEDFNLKCGDEVTVMGFKSGQKYVTHGKILNPDYDLILEGDEVTGLFSTDAYGKKGQSGGPIVNNNGELIGLVVYSTFNNGKEELGIVGGANIKSVIDGINILTANMSSELYK